MNMKTLVSMVSVCECLFFAGGSARGRDLTDIEAQRLVVLSLGKKVSSLPHFGLNSYQDQSAADFYVFEATAEHPNSGSPVIGQFAVNKATGDIWKLGICERMRSDALARAQEAVRKKIGISLRQFQESTVKVPCRP